MHKRIRLLALVVVAFSFALVGCSTSKQTRDEDTTEARVPAPRSEKADTRDDSSSMRRSSDGYIWRSRAYPTGKRSTSTVMVERGTPSEVQVGQPYDYVIRVTNLTNNKLEQVVVNDKPDSNFQMSKANPRPQSSGGKMQWVLGNLKPSETKIIRVSGMAKGTGTITQCCDISWESLLCASTKVVQPKLALTKSGTTAALTCEPIVYKFTVTNGGSGPARNVMIEDKLPSGVKTLKGESNIRIPVGTLAAGQSKSYTVRCKASKTGTFQNVATAKADGLNAKSGTVSTKVTQPKLTINKTGTKKTFIGRTIDYEITVKNVGNGEARNAILEDAIPAGSKFVSASNGGKVSGGMVRWNFGTLQPNASRTVKLRVKAGGSSIIRNTATAKAYCAEAVSDTHETQVTGIPAILLEVVDVEDPIEVGGEVTYVITVTNQGSAPGTNIKIVCNLENTQQFLAASGATRGSHSNRTITFAPLRSLAPKAKATFRVRVKAVSEGDVRFKVQMTSDQLKRPVDETESTNLYK